MKRTLEEIEKRFAEIDEAETEVPTDDDIAAFKAAENELREKAVAVKEYKAAKENGVSLNHYALYKLAK